MRRHHPIVRITHWVNVLALAIMVASGLRIFNAYPAFARRGEGFCCYPLEGKMIPAKLTFGGWLAGARNWHFAMMWLLALNGLVYVAFIYLHGEWRDLVPRRGDLRDAWQMVRFYAFARRDHPHQGKNNTLQKLAYFAMPLLGAAAILTGLAIWKPVQLALLTDALGGYVWARYWHFLVMLALVLLTAVHVFMVLSVDPYSLRSITTGGWNPRLSPEARNARPFYHLLPRWGRPASATGAPRAGATEPPAGQSPPGGETPGKPPTGAAAPAEPPAAAPPPTRRASPGASPRDGAAGPDPASAPSRHGPPTDAGSAGAAPRPGPDEPPAGDDRTHPAGGPAPEER
ncbi:MAG TPA: cytochrome b/b6 domain-containing protein [Longimicrobiales bacterium]|nr:cytochrome b/b6 domain-containing protein [Longimicrobiales bacterium]